MAKQSGRMEESVMNDNEEHIIDNLLLKDGKHIKRAAALLFHKEPEQFVPGAYIKIGFFLTDSQCFFPSRIN
jgi:ATP-dependent DNA helicase RecG